MLWGNWKSGCEHHSIPLDCLSCHVADSYAYSLYQFALHSPFLELLATSVTLCLYQEKGKVVGFLPKLGCSFKLPKVFMVLKPSPKGRKTGIVFWLGRKH